MARSIKRLIDSPVPAEESDDLIVLRRRKLPFTVRIQRCLTQYMRTFMRMKARRQQT
jgi:hypothetical protein